MEYMERYNLANLVMRNANKGDSVPQSERSEEIYAFKRILEEVLLPYRSPFLKEGILNYRWGKWTPPGKDPIWGPYALFSLEGEIWRMAMADPQSIKVLVMAPDSDITNNWDVWWEGSMQALEGGLPRAKILPSLDEFIRQEALQWYRRRRKKR